MKLYEIEIERTNISPKQFFTYCKKQFEKRTGENLDMWIDYEQWINPVQKSNTRTKEETCVLQPFEHHLYYKGAYNFIMEFDFWDDNRGFGYLYAYETAENRGL